MKKQSLQRLLTILAISLLSIKTYSQTIEKYLDYNFKPCETAQPRYYRIVKNTDSGWLCKNYFIYEKFLQMQGLFKDSACTIKNGQFTFFHNNKRLDAFGKYVNNKKEGEWLSFNKEGMMTDSTNYVNDNPVGISMSWFKNGFIKDSINLDQNQNGIGVHYYDNGNLSSFGRYSSGLKREGKWIFYHKNKQISSIEMYSNGKILQKQFYTEQGKAILDTTNPEREAMFSANDTEQKTWTKYFSDRLSFPKNVKFENTNNAKVVVVFVINEEGKVESLDFKQPLFPEFDNVVRDIILRAPKWVPGIDEHNRKRKSLKIQAVNYVQQEED